MKLNNKGFAISTMMYIILILAVLLIASVLSILSTRKLVLDKIKNEVADSIYNSKCDLPNYTDIICENLTTKETGISEGDHISCSNNTGYSEQFLVVNIDKETKLVTLLTGFLLGYDECSKGWIQSPEPKQQKYTEVDSILNSYKEIEENVFSTHIKEVKLMTNDLTQKLGCSGNNCSQAPDWMTNYDYFISDSKQINKRPNSSISTIYNDSENFIRPIIVVGIDGLKGLEIKQNVYSNYICVATTDDNKTSGDVPQKDNRDAIADEYVCRLHTSESENIRAFVISETQDNYEMLLEANINSYGGLDRSGHAPVEFNDLETTLKYYTSEWINLKNQGGSVRLPEVKDISTNWEGTWWHQNTGYWLNTESSVVTESGYETGSINYISIAYFVKDDIISMDRVTSHKNDLGFRPIIIVPKCKVKENDSNVQQTC